MICNPNPWCVDYLIATSQTTVFNLSWAVLNFNNAVLTWIPAPPAVPTQLRITTSNLLHPMNPTSLYTVTFPGSLLATVVSITENELLLNLPVGIPNNGSIDVAFPNQNTIQIPYTIS